MSLLMMSAAFKEQSVDGTTKLVLLALADHAWDNGYCWPGKRSLAEKAGLKNPASVRRHLRKLEDAGLLRSEARFRDDGTQKSNEYWLTLDLTKLQGESDECRGGGLNGAGRGSEESHHEPSYEPSEESTTTGGADERAKEKLANGLAPLIDIVFDHWVDTFNPRSKVADDGQKKIIKDALAVATVDELKTCITACEQSDFHQMRGPGKTAARKHRSLTDILRPKRPSAHGNGYTQRERIDFWLNRFEEEQDAGPQIDWDKRNKELMDWQNGRGPEPSWNK